MQPGIVANLAQCLGTHICARLGKGAINLATTTTWQPGKAPYLGNLANCPVCQPGVWGQPGDSMDRSHHNLAHKPTWRLDSLPLGNTTWLLEQPGFWQAFHNLAMQPTWRNQVASSSCLQRETPNEC